MRVIRAEVVRWAQVIKDAGIPQQQQTMDGRYHRPVPVTFRFGPERS